MQRHNLEILKASVDAKDKHAHYNGKRQQSRTTGLDEDTIYDESTTDNDEFSTYENGVGRRNPRRRKRLLNAEEEAHIGINNPTVYKYNN